MRRIWTAQRKKQTHKLTILPVQTPIYIIAIPQAERDNSGHWEQCAVTSMPPLQVHLRSPGSKNLCATLRLYYSIHIFQTSSNPLTFWSHLGGTAHAIHIHAHSSHCLHGKLQHFCSHPIRHFGSWKHSRGSGLRESPILRDHQQASSQLGQGITGGQEKR